MKILCLSDEECPALWGNYRPELLEGVELMISCGDLDPEYLSFLVTMAGVPLLYVHGNHDERYARTPPEGCDCIDGKVVTVNGLRIAGLGGSRRYKPGPHRYTEGEMALRAARLLPGALRRGGVDLLVTHAAPRGYGDGEDYAHQGFETFNRLLELWKPSHLVHGHVHLNYGPNLPRQHQCGDTTVLNAFGRYLLDIEPKGLTSRKK